MCYHQIKIYLTLTIVFLIFGGQNNPKIQKYERY